MSESENYVFGSKNNESKILKSNGKILGYTVPDNPIAVYSEDDGSLTFCNVLNIPEVGSQFMGKTVTKIYTGVESTRASSSSIPWYSDTTNFTLVVFDESFMRIKPTCTAYWFYGMINLTKVTGLKYLNTANVIYMQYMFSDCNSLVSLDMSNFDTSNVVNMNYMFFNCKSLVSLDVSGFNTAKVTNMENMFCLCSSLTTIYSDDDNFATTAVTSGSLMFSNCNKLVGGNGTAYSDSNTDYQYAHIDVDGNPGYFTDVNAKGAFAVYSADDDSLTFYSGYFPYEGSTYNGKIVTNIYTGFDKGEYENRHQIIQHHGIPMEVILH